MTMPQCACRETVYNMEGHPTCAPISERDGLTIRVKELAQRIDDLQNAELQEEKKARLGRLINWTHEYGASLCPGSRPDTFGEGMRAAKEQVAVILSKG